MLAGDHIRTQPEQIAIVEDRRARPAKKSKPDSTSRVRVDRERGGILLGRKFALAVDVLEALSLLHEPATADEPEDTPLMVKLRESEHKRLKVRAAETGCDMSDLVRRALRAGGMI